VTIVCCSFLQILLVVPIELCTGFRFVLLSEYASFGMTFNWFSFFAPQFMLYMGCNFPYVYLLSCQCIERKLLLWGSILKYLFYYASKTLYFNVVPCKLSARFCSIILDSDVPAFKKPSYHKQGLELTLQTSGNPFSPHPAPSISMVEAYADLDLAYNLQPWGTFSQIVRLIGMWLALTSKHYTHKQTQK
jgi:hypothetical protein